MTRKRYSERQVLETLAWQGIFVCCYRCGEPFWIEAGEGCLYRQLDPEREHLHEVALDGPDIPANCRYSCSNCHNLITNGTKATSAGSSKQRIAKVKRLQNPEASKRPMKSSGRKMPSRPFQKRSKAQAAFERLS